jgi:glycosyltransferase involved in cell wall biosynthesis
LIVDSRHRPPLSEGPTLPAGDSHRPLVSCILATGDRPHFLRQAIRFFLRQTYRNAELVVIDGGERPAEELCAGLLSVRYLRAAPSLTLGAKLNLGIEQARGSILQKIDDDDLYQPAFLDQAVATLESAGTEDAIAAWDCFFVLLRGERELRFSGHGWAAGGTLCFPRKVWERCGFRDLPAAVDEHFLADCRAALKQVCAPELYVLVRHGRNTWRTMRGARVDDYFRSLPGCGRRVTDLVAPIDVDFYAALARQEAVPA